MRPSRTRSIVIWTAVAVVGAVAWGVIALVRGEQISAAWLIFAAVASYAIAYRFYARWIQYRVLGADARRATPAERLDNDVDAHPRCVPAVPRSSAHDPEVDGAVGRGGAGRCGLLDGAGAVAR